MNYPFRIEHFDCDCHSYDHSLRFVFDPTEDDIRCMDIWVDASFPSNRNLWHRIVLAYKYITRTGSMDFSYVSSYGSWIMKYEDYSRLRNFFTEYDIAVMKLKQRGVDGDKQEDDV